MKKVAVIIGLLLAFLILCQTLVLSAGLINEPSTLLFNTGLVLFGLQIFVIVVLVNQTYNLIVKWSKKDETIVEPSIELNVELTVEELSDKEKRVIPNVPPEYRVKLNEGVEPKKVIKTTPIIRKESVLGSVEDKPVKKKKKKKKKLN